MTEPGTAEPTAAAATGETPEPAVNDAGDLQPKRHVKSPPLYWRALRLRHVHPNSWQRALFFEGSLAVAAVMVLADLASAWLLLALPAFVALVVKGHDVLVGWLRAEPPPPIAELAAAEEPSSADVAASNEPTFEALAPPQPSPEPVAASDPEPNVRVVPRAAKPRAARARPGAAAARAQVSAAHTVSRRRSQPKPGDAKGRG